jgi:hypothetical protein
MIDFSKLNIEYKTFWTKHSLQQAIETLRKIDFYISNGKYDTFLLPYSDILKPDNLILYYRLMGSTLTMSEIVTQSTYQDLINIFTEYLKGLIKQITDYQKKIDAEKNLSLFHSIVSSFASLLSVISSKYFLFAIVGIYLYHLTEN